VNVLVTGAAGFVGSHTVEALLGRGHAVVGVDNFNPYYSPEQKHVNVGAISQHSAAGKFVLHELDICQREELRQLFTGQRIDAIVHLAAMAGVRYSLEHPQLYYDVNLSGTLNLLELAKDHGQPRFIFASTSSVYGETKRIPFVEDDLCAEPRAPYPASKRAAEMLGYTYHHLYRLDVAILRFFTVYGPRNRPDMMAYKLAHSAHFGSEVPLFKGGALSRDWTYVDDIVDGIVRAVDVSRGYQILNIGRGQPVLLKDFVQEIERQTGHKATLKSAPMPEGDMNLTWADISKARRLLGYEPRTGLEQGITNLLAWFHASQGLASSKPNREASPDRHKTD
jgi:UDP-glucuronate 4-epimerase